jgi:cytochrome c553
MKTRNLKGWAALAACLCLGGQLAHAQAVGDPDEGRKRFYTCLGCHGIPGQSNAFPTYAVPKLGGQHTDYLVSAFKAYQNGSRKHGSMEGNSAGLNDTDALNVATYLSRFRALNETSPITGNPAAGKDKAAMCGSCHGEDGNSADANNPRLAAQYESFLVKALHDYKKGVRKNPIMNGMAEGLSEQDILDISAYYASQKKGLRIVED